MGERGTWTTKEEMARTLIVAGRSGVDPDCLVARLPNSPEPYWIVEHSGFVCGLNVYARKDATFTPPAPQSKE